MKKVVPLFFLFLPFLNFAQRSCDIELIITRPYDNETIPPNTNIPFKVYVKKSAQTRLCPQIP